jgi:putative molybdopterin biosynthesis protein
MWQERLPDLQISVEFAGSLGGLMALAQGRADIAGAHLWDGDGEQYNYGYVRRILPGRPTVLLGLAYRALGLLVPPGNPQQVQTLADLTRPEVQFINRQPGAGTRVWLDKQLRQNDIDAAQINGYTQEVHTHLQAALAIANGRATAGLAIEAAGTAYGLDFIPLTQERYDLVIPAPLWETPPLRTLAELIASPRFRDAVAALDGYEPVGDTAVYIT